MMHFKQPNLSIFINCNAINNFLNSQIFWHYVARQMVGKFKGIIHKGSGRAKEKRPAKAMWIFLIISSDFQNKAYNGFFVQDDYLERKRKDILMLIEKLRIIIYKKI
ncbi:Uncharacterised protein [uncultured archaeon]|nr:Uncharacterised protein [uncultured archaeon]